MSEIGKSSENETAATRPIADRLTEPQRRHLIELYGDGKQTLYWRPANSGEERCAEILRRKGLVGGSFLSYSDGYYLTDEGRALTKGMMRDAD